MVWEKNYKGSRWGELEGEQMQMSYVKKGQVNDIFNRLIQEYILKTSVYKVYSSISPDLREKNLKPFNIKEEWSDKY